MKRNILLLLISTGPCIYGQANTAVTSGSIGKCAVWNYPNILYNSTAGSMNINSGISITVDQNRNIGAVNLAGNGTLDLSGANGITLSGSSGDINCRWEINKNEYHNVTNNDGNSDIANYFRNFGTFFTAPYGGNYIWLRGSGWSASMSGGGVRNGSIRVIKNNTKSTSYTTFYQNESGDCPASGTITGPTWGDYIVFALTPGNTLQYGGSTKYTNDPSCPPPILEVNLGNAVLLYDN